MVEPGYKDSKRQDYIEFKVDIPLDPRGLDDIRITIYHTDGSVIGSTLGSVEDLARLIEESKDAEPNVPGKAVVTDPAKDSIEE